MPEPDRAVGELQRVGCVAGGDVNAPGGEYAMGDHRVPGRSGRGGHELEMLDVRGAAAARRGGLRRGCLTGQSPPRPAWSLPPSAGGDGFAHGGAPPWELMTPVPVPRA